MSVDESKKVDYAREERAKEAAREPIKPRPKETDFDKVLEKSKIATQMAPQTQVQSKTVTEQAIHESARREEREGEDRRRDDGEKKEGHDSKGKSERGEAGVVDGRIVGKGSPGREGGGTSGGSGGGGGRGGGPGTGAGRRELTRILTKAGAKSLPLDLKGKFAAKMAQAMKGSGAANRTQMTQQVLNKIVQYVRIGINRKGEKEIQLDLHEKIFRGLKLRVTARGGKKVDVHFRTADAEGREVFEKNSDAIRDALAKKGIEVDEIVIS